MLKTILPAAAIALSCAAADAATYTYSYEFKTGDVVSGTLEGTLLSDMNTIDVTSAAAPLLNGAAFGDDVSELSSDDGWTLGTATVTLDGSLVNFAVANSSFTVGFNIISPKGGVGLNDTTFSDVMIHMYRPENWSISVVPLPAGGMLILTGFVAFTLVRRRTAAA